MPLRGVLLSSSLVKTVENYWLSLCRKPSLFLRGATPMDSWPLLLTYDQKRFSLSV